ncbi:MAG: hypothetical protein GY835_04655, partial [bacterium]|nr:hypothetical protein [bacterium]
SYADGRLQDGVEEVNRAQKLYRSMGDTNGAAKALIVRAALHFECQHPQDAVDDIQAAIRQLEPKETG